MNNNYRKPFTKHNLSLELNSYAIDNQWVHIKARNQNKNNVEAG